MSWFPKNDHSANAGSQQILDPKSSGWDMYRSYVGLFQALDEGEHLRYPGQKIVGKPVCFHTNPTPHSVV